MDKKPYMAALLIILSFCFFIRFAFADGDFSMPSFNLLDNQEDFSALSFNLDDNQEDFSNLSFNLRDNQEGF
ncbi:MAG: hypothetical protein WC616_01735 [Candidatus Omnitrophota bacterium]